MSQQPYVPYPPPPQNHPQAVTVLVVGICALVLCQLLGPVAWVMGNRAVRDIDASGGRWAGRDLVTIGRILGIVATAIIALSLLLVIGIFVFGGVLALGSS